MSKNIQATFWAGLALVSVMVGVWTVKRQLLVRPVIHKTSAPFPIEKILTDIFISNIATSSTPANTTIVANISNPTSTQATIVPRRKPKLISNQLSYGDTVAKYANSRIQFSPTCQAIPSRMAAANPLTVMLDNRSNTEQKITVDGKSYGVAAYNYVIVTINEKTLPVNLYINCNQQANVAEIILE